ncbi:MAG: hypothetical protein RL734_651 [Bacteroidota bacterium]|jgi:uncharacterized membrane protein YhaH (DUF805 family)
MNWYIKVLKQYADFKGRASKKEYWMFSLWQTLILILFVGMDNVLGTTFDDEVYGLMYSVYLLATIVPMISVGIRRLHDIGKSAWWTFITFIPLAGPMWMIVLYASDGQLGENQYGPNPTE